jgi:hypothetical protein
MTDCLPQYFKGIIVAGDQLLIIFYLPWYKPEKSIAIPKKARTGRATINSQHPLVPGFVPELALG